MQNSNRNKLTQCLLDFSSDDLPFISPTKTSEDEHRSSSLVHYLNRFSCSTGHRGEIGLLTHLTNGPIFCAMSTMCSEVKPLGISQMLDQKGGPYQSISFLNI